MPPKAGKKKTVSEVKESWCICCQTIQPDKEKALFCSGSYQQWLHRYCASVSADCYKVAKSSRSAFFCFCCYWVRKEEQLATRWSLRFRRLRSLFLIMQLNLLTAMHWQWLVVSQISLQLLYPALNMAILIPLICSKSWQLDTVWGGWMSFSICPLRVRSFKCGVCFLHTSLSDYYCLGKFNPLRSKPRPILD